MIFGLSRGVLLWLKNVKGTVSWDWYEQQSAWLEKVKIGEEPLMVFKVVNCFYEF
jgi:hypothetical protein